VVLKERGNRRLELELNVSTVNSQQNAKQQTTVKEHSLLEAHTHNIKQCRKNTFVWPPRICSYQCWWRAETWSASSSKRSSSSAPYHPTSHCLRYPTEIETQCAPSNTERGDKSNEDSPEYSSLCPNIDPWWPSTHLITRRSSLSGLISRLPLAIQAARPQWSIAVLAVHPLLMRSRWCGVMVRGIDGWFRMPPLDEWLSSVGFLIFAIFNWELAKSWLPRRGSQHGPLTSSWPTERASTLLLSVENDFPSGLASDGLWKALHHIYVRRDTSLQKMQRDTLPVELVHASWE
jgi:hypothetical protein